MSSSQSETRMVFSHVRKIVCPIRTVNDVRKIIRSVGIYSVAQVSRQVFCLRVVALSPHQLRSWTCIVVSKSVFLFKSDKSQSDGME